MNWLEKVKEVREHVLNHSDFRARCLNMSCAENVMSPLAREFMGSDFHHRYHNYEWISYYFGNEYIAAVERITVELAKELFGAGYVEVHPNSGTMACVARVA